MLLRVVLRVKALEKLCSMTFWFTFRMSRRYCVGFSPEVYSCV